MSLVDDIKARIADLKVEKERIKRGGEQAIAEIEADIARLQALSASITSQDESDITFLKEQRLIL